MHSLEKRKQAIRDLNPCPQGIECTTGCTSAYAQNLLDEGFFVLELKEALRLMKRNNEVNQWKAKYVEHILQMADDILLDKMNEELERAFECLREVFPDEAEMLKFCEIEREYAESIKIPRTRFHAEELKRKIESGGVINYLDFIIAQGFKELVDMDRCFFYKNPMDLTLDEFRYFLIYCVDSSFGQALTYKISRDYPELSDTYSYFHGGKLINDYEELLPYLEHFGINLSFIEYEELKFA